MALLTPRKLSRAVGGSPYRKIGSMMEILYYEKRGLIDAYFIHRGENNYRDYTEETIEQLQMVKEAQAAGFTLAEIKEFDKVCRSGEPVTEIAMSYLQPKISAVEEKMGELERVQAYLKNTLEKMLQEEV